jgi:hypothetical protein
MKTTLCIYIFQIPHLHASRSIEEPSEAEVKRLYLKDAAATYVKILIELLQLCLTYFCYEYTLQYIRLLGL